MQGGVEMKEQELVFSFHDMKGEEVVQTPINLCMLHSVFGIYCMLYNHL